MTQNKPIVPTNRFLRISVFVILCTFLYSVVARHRWFGHISADGHQWITATASKFAQCWQTEGAWNLKFALMQNPASIEFGNGVRSLYERTMYVSYPSFFLIIPYFFSWLFGFFPSPTYFMAVNLVIQLVVAVLLFLSAQMLTNPKSKIEWAFCTLAALSYILLPGPMYWHQATFFSDQIVLLWFIGIFYWLLKEPLLTAMSGLQKGLITFGLSFGLVSSDWLGPVAALFIIASPLIFENRSFLMTIRKRLPVLFASLLAFGLYVAQVLYGSSFGELLNKFKERSGLSSQNSMSLLSFLKRMSSNIGAFDLVILAIGLLFLWRSEKKRASSQLIYFLLLPCIAVALLLRNFHFIHSFGSLKFFPFICLVFFGIGPLVAFESKRARKVCLVVCALLLMIMHTQFPFRFQLPLARADFYRELRPIAKFDDVIVSDEFEIPMDPPQALALSGKRIYRLASTDEMRELKNRTAKMNPENPARFVLALDEKSTCRTAAKDWRLLQSMASHVVLYEIPPGTAAWPCPPTERGLAKKVWTLDSTN